MFKKIIITTLSGLCMTLSSAQTTQRIPELMEVGASALPSSIAPLKDVPFDMPQLQAPVFPEFTVNMKDKGIAPEALLSPILNQTIEEVSKRGGGTVVVPAGHWKSGRIVLRSNVNLHIAEGAVIEFGGKAEDYLPAVFSRHEGIEIMGPAAFIYANNENNIAVTGKGKIIGPGLDAEIRKRPNGASVVEKDIPWEMPVAQRIYDGMEGRTFYRPKTISPINCTNVLIEGIHIERSVLWNVVPIYCENVIIRGVTVNSTEVPSGDGIDIESCKNVLIENCHFDTGDDCIAIKSGRNADGRKWNVPSENIVVRRCHMADGHGGIVIGSEISGGYRNLFVEDCTMDSPNLDRVVRIKTSNCRGGIIENIYVRNIEVGECREAVVRINLAYEPKENCNRAFDPIVRNVYLENINCQKSQYGIYLHGLDNVTNIDNINLKDCNFNGVTSKGNFMAGLVGSVSLDNVKINGMRHR